MYMLWFTLSWLFVYFFFRFLTKNAMRNPYAVHAYLVFCAMANLCVCVGACLGFSVLHAPC